MLRIGSQSMYVCLHVFFSTYCLDRVRLTGQAGFLWIMYVLCMSGHPVDPEEFGGFVEFA